jgi:hypothetical protein
VSWRLRGLLALLGAASVGCGGGAPLLHPARTLDAWKVRASGGFSANFVPGSLGSELNAARAESPPPGPMVTFPKTPTYAQGALIAAVVAPGVAPYASARVGLGQQFELGLTYTGRAARVDARHAWTWNHVSLSLGAGATYLFYGDPDGASLPNIDVNSTQGFGLDVPVLVGWESRAGIVSLWAGARGGFDHAGISDTSGIEYPGPPSDPAGGPSELNATRFYGGGLVGAAAGFRHVHVALEFDAAYQSISGRFFLTNATAAGLTLVPAAALWIDF